MRRRSYSVRSRRLTVPLTALLATLSIAASPASARTLQSPTHVAYAWFDDAPMAAIQSFEFGLQAFEEGKYDLAASHWEVSLQAVPEHGHEAARAKLSLDISTAYERQYDTSEQPESLQHARNYLVSYQQAIDAAFPETDARNREHARARDRLVRIDAKLQSTQSTPPLATPTLGGSERPEPPAPTDKYAKKHRGMIAGGAVITLVGVGGLAMLGVGVAQENTPLSIAGLAVSLTGGVVGPVMLYFGVRRRRASLTASLPGAPSIGVLATGRTTGVTVSGRF